MTSKKIDHWKASADSTNNTELRVYNEKGLVAEILNIYRDEAAQIAYALCEAVRHLDLKGSNVD